LIKTTYYHVLFFDLNFIGRVVFEQATIRWETIAKNSTITKHSLTCKSA